jgi:uncharacterized membrane protein
MRTSIAIWLFVGIAIGAFVAGLIRFGNFLDMAPTGRIILVTVISAILLAGIGLYFHFKDYSDNY